MVLDAESVISDVYEILDTWSEQTFSFYNTQHA